MIGYKAFNRDLTCRGFQFKEGGTYEIEGGLKICNNGFHFCKDIALTLEYYPVNKITDNLYAEIEACGDVIYDNLTKHKGCTNKIKIIKVFSDSEILDIFSNKSNSGNHNSGNYNSGHHNSGHYNSGHYNSGNYNSGNHNSRNHNSGHYNSGSYNSGYSNSGNYNSGDHNSGYYNSGCYNSGYFNSGYWNSCSDESGFFNTRTPSSIRVFNKKCTKSVWDKAIKPKFLYFPLVEGKSYKESFQISFSKASKEDIELLKKLPNFDPDVFFELSGIKI